MSLAANLPAKTRPALSLGAVVALLGISQIIGYGTIFYAFAIIVPGLAAEFGVDATLPFTVISVALLVSGLASPFLGRVIDRRGPANVMVAGSVAVALIYGLTALAPTFWLAALFFVLLQVIGVAVLYGASFPTLAQFGADRARRAITQLTLISGFASTLFWPFTGWLMELTDWRVTLAVFAGLHLCIALPVHLVIARAAPAAEPKDALPQASAPALRSGRAQFWMVALSFGITGIVSTALVVHLVPILQLSALGENVYLVSMIVGPAMVLVRLGEALFWANLHPLVTTIMAALCFPLAIGFLLCGLPPLVGGTLFALFYGFGHGLNVIVGGTLPLYLFGRDGYGELLGRLNALRVLLSAGAPAAFSAAIGAAGFAVTMVAGIVIGMAAVVPLAILGTILKRQEG